MADFTDLRAEARHGAAYGRAKALLSIAMIAADGDGELDPAEMQAISGAAATLPGMKDLGGRVLRAAATAILTRIRSDGVEAVFEDAVETMGEADRVAAMLLALRVAMADGRVCDDEWAILKPMATRFGMNEARLTAIRIMAERQDNADATGKGRLH
ncbi:tellurite resistance TerB family protein [uncultured Jannaschia sp.]|uniref:tellurite resistance TerB family protein n=1 Tax=uncultured Jannaschia sp. TaxID=293347 RepID=UPI002612B015|nr:tellurite resistance TerB family protein [uncultured Jannaschia sp.]